MKKVLILPVFFSVFLEYQFDCRHTSSVNSIGCWRKFTEVGIICTKFKFKKLVLIFCRCIFIDYILNEIKNLKFWHISLNFNYLLLWVDKETIKKWNKSFSKYEVSFQIAVWFIFLLFDLSWSLEKHKTKNRYNCKRFFDKIT